MTAQQNLDFGPQKRVRKVFANDKIKMVIWLTKNADRLNGESFGAIKSAMSMEFQHLPGYTSLLNMLKECNIDVKLKKSKSTSPKTSNGSRGNEQVTKKELLQHSYKVGKSGMAIVDALSMCIGFITNYGEMSLQDGRAIQDGLAEAYVTFGKLRRAPKDMGPKSLALMEALKSLGNRQQLED